MLKQPVSKPKILAVALSSLLLALPAQGLAAPFIDSVTGTWENAVGGTNVQGEGTNEITWGTSNTPANRSGFTFDGAAPPSFEIFPDVTFDLGTFTHNNQVINGGGPSTVDLAIVIDFNPAATANTTFNFSFLETPNNGDPCAAGGEQPCPDLVTFLNNGVSDQQIQVGDDLLFLQILGFQTEEGLVEEFLTEENQNNPATLKAIFTAQPVPVPSSALLFMTGVATLIGWKRFKK